MSDLEAMRAKATAEVRSGTVSEFNSLALTTDAILDPHPPLAPLRSFLRLWLKRAGIDRAIGYGVLARSWALLSAPVTLLLIARCFTLEQQGYYYTFASLIALQSFVELNFSLVITSVASHEWSHLGLNTSGRITGDPQAISRLVSLGRLIFQWYAVASAVFLICVGIAGYLFLSQTQSNVAWQGPWVALVILNGVLLWMLPFNALLEGCDQVATVNQFRLSQSMLSSVAFWTTLLLGCGLWAAAVLAAVNVLRDAYLLGVRYRDFFRPFLRPPVGERIDWRRECWPMQWRLGIAGIVNYLAFSLFSPVMFKYHGAAVAGRMGMTLSLVNSIQGLALAWVQTKVPRFGQLIAKRDYKALDQLFLRASIASLVVYGSIAVAIWSVLSYLNWTGHPLASRLLPPFPTALFFLEGFIFQVALCQVLYLRAHKREPIMVLSVISSVLTGLLVWFLGSRFGPGAAASGYLGVYILVLVWVTIIWFRCRAEWHRE